MSKLITNTIRHTGGSADNITLDNSQNVTVEGNATVDGTSTLTGNVTCSGQLKTDAIRHTGASSDAITLASDGTATAKITNQPPGNRNLVINGGMNINQYGSSSTTSTGRKIFDRWNSNWNNGTITQSKETLTSGGAYDAGHRSCLRLTNTSAAGSAAGTYVEVYYKWEAQDIAKSGWNYKSASSYITLSFWLRSSVAQTYSCTIQTRDGTKYFHPFTAVISSADTWTRITKTFAGNSNLQIDDDNGDGLMMWVNPMQGSNFHNNSWNTDGWFAESGNSMFAGTTTTTWGTTAGATWDITGFQLEVGDTATDFEHRSYADELARCQRYHYVHVDGDVQSVGIGTYSGTSTVYCHVPFPVNMRATPTMTVNSDGTNYWYVWYTNDTSNQEKGDNFVINGAHTRGAIIKDPSASGTSGHGCYGRTSDVSAKISFSAEL